MSGIEWQELARAEAYPDDASARTGVEWVQTHLSHVYLTGRRVYKFRKPVDLGFVDFAGREERNADCLREVDLNRRLAPDVYLGVAPLLGSHAEPRLGPPAERLSGDAATVEHCVVMRRLPTGRDALSLLEAGSLTGEMLEALASRIARFHAAQGLGQPAPFSAGTWIERCTGPVEQNFRVLSRSSAEAAPRLLLDVARARARAFASRHPDRFERRRRQGRAVDAHGDLHLQHVWYEDAAEPVAIDCLEFSDALRRIDAASEVAFLAMDLRYRDAPELAERFLQHYARDADDFGLFAVLDYFIAYRAAVRAKVAALASQDRGISPAQRRAARDSARRHLELAGEALEPPGHGTLVLVAGVVGTGKSSVAAELSRRLGAVVIASDRVRKHLAGAEPDERLSEAWGRGAYSPEQKDRVYAALLERARPVLGSGRGVVLDATYSRREHRDAVRELAREVGARPFAVEVACAPELAEARLAARAAAGGDPSDAGPEAYGPSVLAFEALDEWPESERALLRTDRDSWREEAEALVGRIRAPGEVGAR